MGTDIYGWVEIMLNPGGKNKSWSEVISVGVILQRSYDLFGCLFGVKNYAHFAPIAARRGIPAYPSFLVREAVPKAVWPSYLTLIEAASINLDEYALYADSRLNHCSRSDSGELTCHGKAFWIPQDMPPDAMVEEDELGMLSIWHENREWEDGGRLYKSIKLQRRDALNRDWWTLVALMEVLGKRFGQEHVRLVVWFDQ
jgi:hypothetical protein